MLSRRYLGPALYLLVVTLAAGTPLALTLSDKLHATIEKGNRYYDKGEHDEALQEYLKARKQDSLSVIPQFNAGDALYKLGKFQEGAKEFSKTASSSTDSISSMSYYNLGNTAFRGGDYGSAAEAYKKSLLIDPKDEDAKYNLEYALRMVKEQQQQQNQNQQNQDQKNQDKQNQQEQQSQQDRQNQPDQSQAKEQQQPGQSGQPQGEMTPDELKRILAAIDASDRETQQELLKKAARTRRLSDKDW